MTKTPRQKRPAGQATMGTHFHSPDADMPEIIGDTACPATAAAVPNMPSSICRPSIIWPAPRIEIGKGVGRSPETLWIFHPGQLKSASQAHRRGDRVVDCAGLENRCTFAGTVGSNPTPSATYIN